MPAWALKLYTGRDCDVPVSPAAGFWGRKPRLCGRKLSVNTLTLLPPVANIKNISVKYLLVSGFNLILFI